MRSRFLHLITLRAVQWLVREPVSPRLAKGKSPVSHWSALLLFTFFSFFISAPILACEIIAERLSARQLILHRISEIVCMYVSVTLRNPIISRATRKRIITCASVTLRNVIAGPAIVRRETYNYSAGRRRRRCTHTTQWQLA